LDSFVHSVWRHDHSAEAFQPHEPICIFACALACSGVVIGMILGLSANAGVATTILAAITATDKHRCMNFTLDPFARFHLAYHDFPPQISFSMTDSFR
jgi:hypothetical protein